MILFHQKFCDITEKKKLQWKIYERKLAIRLLIKIINDRFDFNKFPEIKKFQQKIHGSF